MRELAGRSEPGSGAPARRSWHRQRHRPRCGRQPRQRREHLRVGLEVSRAGWRLPDHRRRQLRRQPLGRGDVHRSRRDGAALLHRSQRGDVHALRNAAGRRAANERPRICTGSRTSTEAKSTSSPSTGTAATRPCRPRPGRRTSPCLATPATSSSWNAHSCRRRLVSRRRPRAESSRRREPATPMCATRPGSASPGTRRSPASSTAG